MNPSWVPLAITLLLLAVVIWTFSRYNGLVRSKKRVDEPWSGIDVQLRRRASLIPNLLEVVKGPAEHERRVFDDVARARGAVQHAAGPRQSADACDLLSQECASVLCGPSRCVVAALAVAIASACRAPDSPADADGFGRRGPGDDKSRNSQLLIKDELQREPLFLE